MAAVVTGSAGYDAGYPWAQVGSAQERQNPGDYYLRPAEGGGEPPGRWWGTGAERLGLAGEVERKPWDLLITERLDPRDGVTRLGKAPGGRSAEALYGRMLEAEPQATAERRAELHREAEAKSRQSPLYWDLTVSLSKSISVYHASIGENIRQAHIAGDAEAEAEWTATLAELNEMIYAANRAGLEYFQEEAGYTRTGSHAARIDGRETGQWHEADLAVAVWLQHTSRDGDPQMHLHNTVAHTAYTRADGKWRAPDTYGYSEFYGAMASIVALHLESAMTARFGVEWELREDGYGAEIKGITAEIMHEFSSRRQAINEATRELARQYEADTGRAPSQGMLAKLAQSANLSTRHGKEGALDLDQLRESWDTRLRELCGLRLRDIAPDVSNPPGSGAPERRNPDPRNPGGATAQGLSRAEERRAAEQALAAAQAEKSAWTRADLIKHLGRVMLPKFRESEPAGVREVLDRLADEALAGEFGEVACLEAPMFPEMPASLIREDGRPVYQRHGGTRYATHVQLSTEEKLVRQAAEEGAPCLSREDAAQLLGTTPERMDEVLRERAETGAETTLDNGLREDQAAAIFYALTDPRRLSGIVGPAGSGKSHAAGMMAQIWRTAGGSVIGLGPSQSATNTLRDAINGRASNLAQFLGHLPEARGALGHKPVDPGTLIIIDESSMANVDDIAAIVAIAHANSSKVIMIGDNGQLTAVQQGGAFTLLTDRLGWAQLARVVRMYEKWEQEASLRLRASDASALNEYAEHGRIRGGAPEDVLDDARKAYVAGYLTGRDVILMAQSHDTCREMSRRIRDDLIHLGYVSAGRSVPLREGARASVGDLIQCKHNDHKVGGVGVANGDYLRVERIESNSAGETRVIVSKAIDADPVTGGRRYGPEFIYNGYREHATLAYCATGHAAQGRTVSQGIAVITGSETRNWAYVATSRGRDSNDIYGFTSSPRVAEPRPGVRPAPELERMDAVERERAGLPPLPREPEEDKATAPVRDVLAMLTDVFERDGAEVSALEYQWRELANADHLAVLNAMYEGQTRKPLFARYESLLREAVPDLPEELSAKATWLWLTLRAAEAAGCDAGEVIQRAVDSRSLAGAGDIAAVVDSRVREDTASLVPLPARPYADQVADLLPFISDPGMQRFVVEVAEAMDNRVTRLGEFTVEAQPAWAVKALSAVPDEPLDRLEWTNRAGAMAAYRELYSYNDPANAIGPEPSGNSPESRAVWHGAFAGLGPVDGVDVRGLHDGSLLNMRSTYPTETAWAPAYMLPELEAIRLSITDHEQQAIRANAYAQAAIDRGDHQVAENHRLLSKSSRAAERIYREREIKLADAADARREWEQATEQQRRLAVAADSEYRTRHPDAELPPMRSAEPPVPAEDDRAALLDVDTEPAWLDRLAEQARAARERIDRDKGMRVPNAEDHEMEDEGFAWDYQNTLDRDAVLQPAKPQMPAAEPVMEAAREREHAEPEAAN